MSHDLYASWATQEVTRLLISTPNMLFATGVYPNLSVYASRESGRLWPIPDGRITAESNNDKFEIAVELKRINEGLHGVLTAMGQAQAYIHKGYSGAAIIIPNSYDSYPNPGNYIQRVLDAVQPNSNIGVYSYGDPDLTIATPFLNKITTHRNIGLTQNQRIPVGSVLNTEKSKTQWAHLREGSSDSDAFFRYLQIAKQLDSNNPTEPNLQLPNPLIQAVSRVSGDSLHYLSNSPGNTFHDIVWRNFWFKYILTPQVAELWTGMVVPFTVNDVHLGIKMDATTYKKFFSGRRDSPKNRIVESLNAGNINQNDAWEMFAENIHDRAHSYREDIDSGLSHLGFLTEDGKPSDLGYRFVDAVERTGDSYTGKPWSILGSAILKNGNLASFLHYIYKVSEKAFKENPLRFVIETPTRNGVKRTFDKGAYLAFMRNELANTLNVMNTSVLRGGNAREAFQGEFAILRKFGFIQNYRIGVGLEINWPAIQDFLDYDL